MFLLNLKDFKSKAAKMTLDCINKIKEKLPKIFEISIQEMTKNLSNALTQMENKPIGIESFIVFQNNKSNINNDL